jgi:hypothetical protein
MLDLPTLKLTYKSLMRHYTWYTVVCRYGAYWRNSTVLCPTYCAKTFSLSSAMVSATESHAFIHCGRWLYKRYNTVHLVVHSQHSQRYCGITKTLNCGQVEHSISVHQDIKWKQDVSTKKWLNLKNALKFLETPLKKGMRLLKIKGIWDYFYCILTYWWWYSGCFLKHCQHLNLKCRDKLCRHVEFSSTGSKLKWYILEIDGAKDKPLKIQ